jgi:uncharacterized protein YehS (DUF1456 family)
MTSNDVLRSIRYLLNVSDAKIVEITALSGLEITRSDIVAFLKKEEEEGFEACPHLVMTHFLNGLVTFKRGVDKTKPPQQLETPVTNNTVLKKLRVAFELKDTDLIAMIEAAGLKASKTELSAFFRKKGHRNYRECGDQFLRAVLKGLTP